ncbi:glycosyltransferase family 4 protein [Komarekiella sp. 'clone 1']|uniref:Glycosyltransferase family 4 protein n=1 Tax=Komarekiella delphini-convector SJRDD-AB1 TaxID=2593771 RepID=A0AA40T1U1_9NOST|nr:glycosyltransferase family 4 protein [Komarekiella delphini-convector]MBD6619138.1 glycosyltransferase family 4 protein [Komarekiella delphini-convector SJRDD-AB1]
MHFLDKPLIKNICFKIFSIAKVKEYKYPYILEKAKSKFSNLIKNNLDDHQLYDLVFVIHDAKGWILEAICREIATYFPGKYFFAYSLTELPQAKAYFFAHYSFLPIALKQNPILWQSKLLVWYTHPKDIGRSNEELIYTLNQSTKVICTCSQFVELLKNQGVNSKKTTFILGGADPAMFQPHQRLNGAVGFCTAYYARKSPELIFNIIKSMPHRKFILLGRDWDQYERFEELIALPNLSYIQAPYSDYPKYYAEMDVFVSPAKLEGGPIPLIEAMMCNIVPVASRTGFAPDIINHGENGFIFDIDSPGEVVCKLIDQAFNIPANISKTVEHLTWKNFSLEVQELLK